MCSSRDNTQRYCVVYVCANVTCKVPFILKICCSGVGRSSIFKLSPLFLSCSVFRNLRYFYYVYWFLYRNLWKGIELFNGTNSVNEVEDLDLGMYRLENIIKTLQLKRKSDHCKCSNKMSLHKLNNFVIYIFFVIPVSWIKRGMHKSN